MNPSVPKDIQRWEKVRRGGKWRFVLINGVVSWGVPMFVVMTFVVNRSPDRPLTPGLVGISAALWAFGGFSFGLVMWTISERRYQKHLATRATADGD
jgi:hypothetical protein